MSPVGSLTDKTYRPCPWCGSWGPHALRPGTGVHWKRVVCACGCFWWARRPDNVGKHRRSSHRKAWRQQQGGELRCLICGRSEAETLIHVHHRVPVGGGHGGPDLVGNTEPLCRSCHTERHGGEVRA